MHLLCAITSEFDSPFRLLSLVHLQGSLFPIISTHLVGYIKFERQDMPLYGMPHFLSFQIEFRK